MSFYLSTLKEISGCMVMRLAQRAKIYGKDNGTSTITVAYSDMIPELHYIHLQTDCIHYTFASYMTKLLRKRKGVL